jgi:hypothetical protein
VVGVWDYRGSPRRTPSLDGHDVATITGTYGIRCSAVRTVGAHATIDSTHSEITHNGAWMPDGCHMPPSRKVPTPKEIKAAAQAAADTAQAAASEAMRIPTASIQITGQLPDLIESLAVATERLNQAIDRAERYLALADPMIRTMDAILPQLEALVATGNEVYGAVSSLPGVSTLGRFAGRGANPSAEKQSPKGRGTRKKT